MGKDTGKIKKRGPLRSYLPKDRIRACHLAIAIAVISLAGFVACLFIEEAYFVLLLIAAGATAAAIIVFLRDILPVKNFWKEVAYIRDRPVNGLVIKREKLSDGKTKVEIIPKGTDQAIRFSSFWDAAESDVVTLNCHETISSGGKVLSREYTGLINDAEDELIQ